MQIGSGDGEGLEPVDVEAGVEGAEVGRAGARDAGEPVRCRRLRTEPFPRLDSVGDDPVRPRWLDAVDDLLRDGGDRAPPLDPERRRAKTV